MSPLQRCRISEPLTIALNEAEATINFLEPLWNWAERRPEDLGLALPENEAASGARRQSIPELSPGANGRFDF